MHIGPRVKWPPPPYVVFPVDYPETPEGLRAAQDELGRLVEIHDGYANQPDISPIWQGYIDQKAAAVAHQQAVIETIQANIRAGFERLANETARTPLRVL